MNLMVIKKKYFLQDMYKISSLVSSTVDVLKVYLSICF